MLALRIIVGLCALAFMVGVCRQVAKGRLLLRYSLTWLALGTVAVFIVILPEPIFWLSSVVGFVNPSNFVFFVVLFFVLIICLNLSVVISRQQSKIKNLVQDLALLESRIEKD